MLIEMQQRARTHGESGPTMPFPSVCSSPGQNRSIPAVCRHLTGIRPRMGKSISKISLLLKFKLGKKPSRQKSLAKQDAPAMQQRSRTGESVPAMPFPSICSFPGHNRFPLCAATQRESDPVREKGHQLEKMIDAQHRAALKNIPLQSKMPP